MNGIKRVNMKKIIVLLAAIFTLNVAEAQWQPINTPFGNAGMCIGLKDSLIFAGSYHQEGDNLYWYYIGDFYKSSDNGNTWTLTNLSFYIANVIAINGNNIFVGGSNDCGGMNQYIPCGSLFRSTDNGNNWTAIDTGLTNTFVNALATNGTYVFAGTSGGGMFRSADNGNNWVAINTGLEDTIINAIAIIGNNIFAGANGGIYRSADNGNSWIAIDTGLTSLKTYSLITNGSNILAGTSGGVFLSVNNGDSWTAANNGLPVNTGVWTLANHGNNIFTIINHKVYLSTNNGGNWVSINNGFPALYNYISTIAVSDSFVYVGGDNSNLWKRSLSDILYKPVDAGAITGPSIVYRGQNTETYTVPPIVNATSYVWTLPNGAIGSSNTNSINVIYGNNAISGNVTVRGHNDYGDGESSTLAISVNPLWVQTSLNNKDIYSFATSGNKIFAGGDNGVYLSTDNGNSWTLGNTGLTGYDVDALLNYGNNIFAGTGDNVYLSTNNGTNWVASDTGFSISGVFALAKKENNIFVGTYCNGVYLSTDNGNNWISVNTGLTDLYIKAIAVKDSSIFVGTGYDGVYISTNNGNSWSSTGLSDILVWSIAIHGNNIYAGTDNGIYVSTDNGINWSVLNNGLPLNTVMSSIVIADSIIFTGTFGSGVYMSTDNGNSWVAVNDGLKPNYIHALTISNNTLFAGGSISELGVWELSLSDTVTTSTNSLLGGTTTGGGHFFFKQTCTVKATPNPEYLFTCWTENGDTVSTDTCYTFTVTANRNLFANFSALQGINSNSLNESIHIYPNPAKDILTIETNSNTEQRLEILNLMGQTVYTTIINKKATINTTAFANGVYILKLYTDKETVVRKFVKE